MSDARELLKSRKFNAVYSVSNIEANSERRACEIDREMSEEIARLVTSSGQVKINRLEYSTEYRLSVYVLSGDDLHRLINEEAMRLSGMISRNMSIQGLEP